MSKQDIGSLVRFAYLLVGTDEDAEALARKALESVFTRATPPDGDHDVEVLDDIFEAIWRLRRTPSDDEIAFVRLPAFMSAFTLEERAAAGLFYLADFTGQEISDLCGITTADLTALLERCRAAIRVADEETTGLTQQQLFSNDGDPS
ncbi:MAG TPA: hypothetical protein VIT21_01350 [Chthoniobacterales bacterium]